MLNQNIVNEKQKENHKKWMNITALPHMNERRNRYTHPLDAKGKQNEKERKIYLYQGRRVKTKILRKSHTKSKRKKKKPK